MTAEWVVLPTDALIAVLVAATAAFAAWSAGREPLRRPWRAVVRRPLALASAVVLAAYVLVGLLDSVHYHPASADGGRAAEVQSLLDAVARPLRERVERSYSAPFATRAYDRMTIELADGTVSRDYPPLAWGGAHLKDGEAGRSRDVRRRSVRALWRGGAVWVVLAGAAVAAAAGWAVRRNGVSWGAALAAIARGRAGVAWRSLLAASLAVVLAASWAAHLAPYYHILGTDKVGQDVFYLSLKSVRTGLVLGTVTSLVMLPFAVLMGTLAGYCGGWVDDVIQYVYTTLSSVPGVLLIAASILMVHVFMETHPDAFPTAETKADVRLLSLCVILGVTGWIGLCRLLRGETLKLREMEYVQASIACGAGLPGIVARHLLPNVMHLVLIAVVLDFSGLVLSEAVLSYIGIGVSQSMASWGNMINAARLEMAREPMVWWSLASAFGFMLVLVLAANLFADAVRDAFDPRMKT